MLGDLCVRMFLTGMALAWAGTIHPQIFDVTAALSGAILPSRDAVERSRATCLSTLLYDLFPSLEAFAVSSLWRLL